MNTNDNHNSEKDKKTVNQSTDRTNEENLTSGETSSLHHLDRSGFTNKPKRKSTPLGSSHEPGTTPGTEL